MKCEHKDLYKRLDGNIVYYICKACDLIRGGSRVGQDIEV